MTSYNNPSTPASVTTRQRSPIQLVTVVVSVVFLLVGIAGFIPGLTTHYSDMSFAGHTSMAMLLGVFMVSVLHNVVHILYGVVGLAASRTPGASRAYLIAGGVVYAVLWLYGLLVDQASNANFVPLNTADNWLHLVLAVGMIGLGLAVPRRSHAVPTAARA